MGSVPDNDGGSTFQPHNDVLLFEQDWEAYRYWRMDVPYMDLFCQRFSELAPEAWADLATLFPEAAMATSTFTGSPEGDEAQWQDAISALTGKVEAWAERYQIGADWVINAALGTLLAARFAERAGESLPTTLLFREIPDLRPSAGGGLDYHGISDPIGDLKDLETYVDTRFRFSTWPVHRESLSDFKKRVVREFSEYLNGLMETNYPDAHLVLRSSPKPQWVEWLIAVRVRRGSVRGLAKSMGRNPEDTGTIRHALKEIEKRLFPNTPRKEQE